MLLGTKSVMRQCSTEMESKMGFYKYIGSQFSNPRGIIGKVCCIIMNIMNKSMYHNVANRITLSSNSKLLDIGYGNGYFIHKLYHKSKSNFYGIDISEDILKNASKKNKKGIARKKVHLEIGDCCNMSYRDNFFDVVTSVNTIYFWNDTKKGLSEIYRVLKKDGVFLNAFYSKAFLQQLKYTREGFQYFEPKEIKNLAKKVGFSNVIIKRLSNGKGFIMHCVK